MKVEAATTRERNDMANKCKELCGTTQMPAIIYKGQKVPVREFGSIEYLTFCPELQKRLG